MEIGIFKWLNLDKGYGVLITPDNKEIFFHRSNWQSEDSISDDLSLPIIFEKGVQRSKATALNCRYFNPRINNDWSLLNQYLIDKRYKDFIIQEDRSSWITSKSFNPIESVFNYLNTDASYSTTAINLFINSIILNEDKDFLLDHNHLIFSIAKINTTKEIDDILQKNIREKAKALNSEDLWRFIKTKIYPNYIPDSSEIKRIYHLVDNFNLNHNTDIQPFKLLILFHKLESLEEEFDETEFKNFDTYLRSSFSDSYKFIEDTDKYIELIKEGLNNLAEEHFDSLFLKKLEDIFEIENVSFYTIKQTVDTFPQFIDEKTKARIGALLKSNTLANCSFLTITQCCEEGYFQLDDDIIREAILRGDNDDLYIILDSTCCTDSHNLRLIEALFNRDERTKLLEYTNRLPLDLGEEYNNEILSPLSIEELFTLWENKKISTFYPQDFLKLLNHEEKYYTKLIRFLDHSEKEQVPPQTVDSYYINRQPPVLELNKDEVTQFLLDKLNNAKAVESRYDFYTLYYSIKTLSEINPNFIYHIEKETNDYIDILLWHFELVDDNHLNFDSLKSKFIYFNPEEQIKVFKRLFYLKRNGYIDFDINRLDEIIRADLDLYLINEEFKNDFALDISTHVIIEAIKSFVEKGSFLFESDLIIKDLINNSDKKFLLEHYFNPCPGKTTQEWDWKRNGEVKKIRFDNTFYYAVYLDTGFKPKYGRFIRNENFRSILDALHQLPIRKKWNPAAKHWGVPARYENEILQFAKSNRMMLVLDNGENMYKNNPHMATLELEQKPDGIMFCEGRKSYNKDSYTNKEYWSCKHDRCFKNAIYANTNDTSPKDDNWQKYTMYDFLNILNINTDEVSRVSGNLIENGNYALFMGHINAFNRMLEKMYCHECNNLLYPINSSHFALHRVNRFHCINDNCSQKHIEVYLNKCLNGECYDIIDSRISKSCNNGLFICRNCGTCCSTEMFGRRIRKLSEIGAYIHPQLIDNYENQKGHLEKAEYYCYKCRSMMRQQSNTYYTCSSCNVSYDLSKFKWLDRKWTLRNLRRKDYPVTRY